jgi:Fic/DOC family
VNRYLAPVPRLSDELFREHCEAHRALDLALANADPAVARLLTRFAFRVTVESIAHVRPTHRGGTAPDLFPAPRSFLSQVDTIRVQAAGAAYRHVDSRLAMVNLGYESPPALRPETPYVLHALVEGPVGNPDETNPGMVRGRDPEAALPAAGRPMAPSNRCRELVDDAVEQAVSTDAPAVARAGWMLFTLGEIHPFVDGNGRVARLLYLLITGEEMPRTVDWGVAEQILFHQDRWMEALRQPGPGPVTTTVTELSTAGARLMSDRLASVGKLVTECGRRLGLAPEPAVLAVATWIRRAGRVDELALDVGGSSSEVLALAEPMVTAGLLERHHRRTCPPPDRPAFAVGPALVDEIRDVLGSA